MKVLMVDPPSGWMYGFPRVAPREVLEDNKKFRDWLSKHGYPDDQLDFAVNNTRFWEEEC